MHGAKYTCIFSVHYLTHMKNLIFVLLATLLSITASNKAFCLSSGQPENEALANQLKYFTVKTINNTSLLSWSSSSPIKYNYFSVERSQDGKTYIEIGRVKSESTTNFHFVDFNPDTIINYYRFKKIGLDGTIAISPVRVLITATDSLFTVYPTLVNKTLTLKYHTDDKFDINSNILMLFVATGEVMKEYPLKNFIKKMDINVASLPSGNYVAVITKKGKIYNHSFVKQ